MVNSSLTVVEKEKHDRLSLPEQYRGKQSTAPRFLPYYSKTPRATAEHQAGVIKGDKTVCVKRGFLFTEIK
jgi:hypothetical protein